MFDTEQKLVDEVTSLLESDSSKVPKSLRYKNQMVLKEVNLGYGIADIVLTECITPTENRKTFLNLLEIKLLNIINRSPGITIERIVKKTRLDKQKVRKGICSLENFKLVRTDEGRLAPLNDYTRTVINSIAIEAKLRNWKRALNQAYRYKWFSQKSFVCLPSNTIKPASKNIDIFKKMGVGLIEVCKQNGIKILYNPRPKRPISKEMSILLNECVLNELQTSL